MEKYYIATSTLNFNNILATESISPEAFYLNRNFGYKRFTKVKPNPFANSLIAYNKVPLFNIDESDFDDYPMVIEINESLLSKEIINNSTQSDIVKIFQIYKTIYLHPNKVQFLFFSEKHKKTCLIKAEPSIETKLLPVYESKMQSVEKTSNSFRWNQSTISKLKDLSDSEIQKQIELDSKLNRLKGFYYAYFLGFILSTSDDQESLKENFISITKLIDDFDTKNKSTLIDSQIIDDLHDFKLKVGSADGNKNVPNEELIKAIYLEDSGIKEQQKLIEFLKQMKSGKDSFYSQLELNIQQKSSYDRVSFLIDNFIEYLNKDNSGELISAKSSRIIKYLSTLKQRVEKKTDPSFTVNFNNYRVTQFIDNIYKNRGAELYQNVINDLLDYPIFNIQSFLEEKMNLALKIGQTLKDFIEDWKNSNERVYLNSLLDNIENFQPFEIKNHRSEILQSIAVFILKGEDPDKLMKALRQNKIADYRIALGLWGAIFGFSALPKTLTNSLFQEKYLEKTKIFYQDVQKKLHNAISDESLNIEPVVIKHQPIFEDKPNHKRINENYKAKPKQKTIPSHDTEKIFKCPQCGADMVLRKHHYGDFFGCTEYYKTKCLGKRDLKGNELDDKFKVVTNDITKDTTINLSKLILEYVAQNGHCKISELIDWIKEQNSSFSYGVAKTENYIKNNLKAELELKKMGRASGVKKREKGMFG